MLGKFQMFLLSLLSFVFVVKINKYFLYLRFRKHLCVGGMFLQVEHSRLLEAQDRDALNATMPGLP